MKAAPLFFTFFSVNIIKVINSYFYMTTLQCFPSVKPWP